MKAALGLRPAARKEFDEAADWYEQQEEGLRAEFVHAVDEALLKIIDDPLSFALVQGSKLRRALVRRFPYAIFFDAEPGKIVVYAVFHTSRNPMIWRGRID